MIVSLVVLLIEQVVLLLLRAQPLDLSSIRCPVPTSSTPTILCRRCCLKNSYVMCIVSVLLFVLVLVELLWIYELVARFVIYM